MILTLSGPVTPQEVVQLINEAGEKCKACLHLVFNLDRAELSAPLLKPLFALREAQKYLKPQIWLASARHPGADARTTNDTLKLLDNPDGATIVKIATMKSEVANFAAKRDEIEHEIRQLLSLSEGYSQEDFDDALAAARANRAVVAVEIRESEALLVTARRQTFLLMHEKLRRTELGGHAELIAAIEAEIERIEARNVKKGAPPK
ncbi:MAG: hypothetical protein HY075_04740 [Deltaproteobacteria bacterium]|nr:hypothetical protein [Deltaproteobacteria bacterium]